MEVDSRPVEGVAINLACPSPFPTTKHGRGQPPPQPKAGEHGHARPPLPAGKERGQKRGQDRVATNLERIGTSMDMSMGMIMGMSMGMSMPLPLPPPNSRGEGRTGRGGHQPREHGHGRR